MRWYAVGDPQTSFERFLAVLDARGLLAGDRLKDEVGLVSMGDHFDYGKTRGPEVGASGLRILEWLADHAPEQVVILFGNHDLSRVMELNGYDDAGFAEARAMADRVKDEGLPEADFLAAHPSLPTAEIAHRDYSAFSVEQQRAVRRLLEAGRARLAHATTTEAGDPLLLTHAGVSRRELERLDVGPEPVAIARALNALLDERVAAVAPDWDDPLDLTPLHYAGVAGREGGGLLYHRPADPEAADEKPELYEGDARRRFRLDELPAGLLQAAGHLPHAKSLKIMGRAVTEAARRLRDGQLRALALEEDGPVYGPWPRPLPEPRTALILIDGKMNEQPPDEYELLPIGAPSEEAA